jgi:hypothetical protein
MLLAVLVMLVTACSTALEDTTDTSPTSTIEQTTGTVGAASDEVTIIEDIVYLEMDGHEYLVDVYVPPGEGSWPVVVAFHGGPLYKEHSTNTFVATAAAEAGMVVFVPNWVADWPELQSDEDAESMREAEPVYRCALAFAQQEAAGYGGDGSRTVTYGFSAGVRPAVTLSLGPETEPAPGCLAQQLPIRPVGVVLGDGEYFYHRLALDRAFEEDAEDMQALIDQVLDPASWPADLSARYRLWAAETATHGRTFDDPWEESGWFAQRDPDGTIREDLDELGQLDDGLIAMSDAGILLTARLQQAGIDATIDLLPGRHTTIDKVPETVAYLLDAAGPG